MHIQAYRLAQLMNHGREQCVTVSARQSGLNQHWLPFVNKKMLAHLHALPDTVHFLDLAIKSVFDGMTSNSQVFVQRLIERSSVIGAKYNLANLSCNQAHCQVQLLMN